ncbi:uncharacterized protein LOC110653037 [Hevea brasiliensis]|uniref:uncharacterized protein LOC110653037 n=1 Tax=Hevea brasiliensis TaxID=3981 RepID=UPI0025FA720F|nr:uncharacterized protein LOC110653037 [Hevea brasiliensis]
MGSLMMKKLLFLILIFVGSISCSLGVEFDRFPSGKGRKDKIACQFIRRSHPRRSRYFACEGVKRNHMNIMGKYSPKYENLLPTGSVQIDDANLRYNWMPRLPKRHI